MAQDAQQFQDKKKEDAARAAWLSFIGGRTQDEIAAQLDLSRQAVQRLIALAVSENLVKFRVDHPIAACMDLARRLEDRFGLDSAEVAISDQANPGALSGVAILAAARLERLLKTKEPMVLGVGTGRTMRAAVEQMDTLNMPQHKVISLLGNITVAGAASPYDVVMRLGDKVGAERYPFPAPVLTTTTEDRAYLHAQPFFENLMNLRAAARAIFIGVGAIDERAPIRADGFFTADEVAELIESGAVGELTSRPFDCNGEILDTPVTRRIAGLPLEAPPQRQTVIVAAGEAKCIPLLAALRGKLCTSVVIDEDLAKAVLREA